MPKSSTLAASLPPIAAAALRQLGENLAIARSRQTEEQMLAARQELDRQLRPYRGKMSADQLTMLEKQYLERHLLEKAGLPRLSLFYMR